MMGEVELTPQERELVREFVEIPPCMAVERQDVVRAKLARAEGARFRKLGSGRYQIVTTRPDRF